MCCNKYLSVAGSHFHHLGLISATNLMLSLLFHHLFNAMSPFPPLTRCAVSFPSPGSHFYLLFDAGSHFSPPVCLMLGLISHHLSNVGYPFSPPMRCWVSFPQSMRCWVSFLFTNAMPGLISLYLCNAGSHFSPPV